MNPHMLTQMQIRNNAQEMNSFFADLNEWQDQIKHKDQRLRDGEEADGPGFYELLDDDADLLQDVNPEVLDEEELKEHAKATAEKFLDQQRIKPKTYQEYNDWDKFNVDEQLKAFDEKERQEAMLQKKKDALKRQKQKNEERLAKRDEKQEAEDLKEEGNDAFRQGNLEEALEAYTLSILANPKLFSSYSNRSAVLHKLGRHADAEQDAEKAIELNKRFTKGYLRRGAAREAQGKMEEALKDFSHALTLEPCNRETKKQVRRVKKALGMPVEETEEEAAEEVPLTKITIVDYGSDDDYDDPNQQHSAKKVEQPVAEKPGMNPLLSQLVEPEELPIPKSSTQFEHVWSNTLKHNQAGRVAYINKVTTRGIEDLFKSGVDTELFTEFLEVAADAMEPQAAYEILLALSKTKRFEMNTMMATKTDHEYVEKITSRLAEAGFTEQDCFVLKKRYGL